MLIMKGEDNVGERPKRTSDLCKISADCFCVFKTSQGNKIYF